MQTARRRETPAPSGRTRTLLHQRAPVDPFGYGLGSSGEQAVLSRVRAAVREAFGATATVRPGCLTPDRREVLYGVDGVAQLDARAVQQLQKRLGRDLVFRGRRSDFDPRLTSYEVRHCRSVSWTHNLSACGLVLFCGLIFLLLAAILHLHWHYQPSDWHAWQTLLHIFETLA